MRRFDKKENIAKANIIVEQNYLKLKGSIKEEGDYDSPENKAYREKHAAEVAAGNSITSSELWRDGNKNLQELLNNVVKSYNVTRENAAEALSSYFSQHGQWNT